VINGIGDLTFFGAGTLSTHIHTYNLAAAETYAGNTTIEATSSAQTIVKLNSPTAALPAITVLTMNSALQSTNKLLSELMLNGNNQTVAGLSTTTVTGNIRIVNGSATPSVLTINNTSATVYGAALASRYAGLYQVAIQVPNSIADGDWPIIATIGGVSSPSGVLLSVKR